MLLAGKITTPMAWISNSVVTVASVVVHVHRGTTGFTVQALGVAGKLYDEPLDFINTSICILCSSLVHIYIHIYIQ